MNAVLVHTYVPQKQLAQTLMAAIHVTAILDTLEMVLLVVVSHNNDKHQTPVHYHEYSNEPVIVISLLNMCSAHSLLVGCGVYIRPIHTTTLGIPTYREY